jgi:DNA polymerase (family 10)
VTNAELARALRDLRDYLIIAGYEESHATRYTHISRHIEKMAEPVTTLAAENRLREIPMVGDLIASYIQEILRDGISSKHREWEHAAPLTVLELVRVPLLGPKTARMLWQNHQIGTLAQLQQRVQTESFPGIGPKLRTAILETRL